MKEITKQALGAALKKLLSERTLEKISIKDISKECAVNRQTFYYHFKDVFDLFEWVFTEDTKKAISID
ncbi:MAG: TetR family transcriptional regulator, partial [Anaerovoracaceae bacterium]